MPEAKEAIGKIAQFVDKTIEAKEGAKFKDSSLTSKTLAFAELSWTAFKFGKSKLSRD